MKRALLIIFLFSVVALQAQSVYVPPRHWLYEFLEKLETRRVLKAVLTGTKPMTRTEMAEYLKPLLASDSLQRTLSRTERRQLEYARVEFREELATAAASTSLTKAVRHPWIDPWLPDTIYQNGRNLLAVESAPFRLYLDPIVKRQRLWATADSLDGEEKVFENGNGLRLWGSAGRFGYYIDVRDHQEWGSRDYPGIVNYTRERLGFVRGNAHGLDHDETTAYILYTQKYFSLCFGKDVNRWGPGSAGQLALSDHPTSYDQLKFSLGNDRIKFTSLTAVLQHYSDTFFDNGHEEKYLAAHRLEMAPWSWLNIGLHETIIYGGRKFEAAYLNPVMFYRSAEHYLGDRDNATMGLDFEWFALCKTKLYGELFIDDISTGKLNSGFYGNKFAYTVGAWHVNALGISDLNLRAEYTRIRPHTYNHSGITGYWHYNTLLGHWSGPNSDHVLLEAAWRPTQPLSLKGSAGWRRHGANPVGSNVGGDPFVMRDPDRDPEFVSFLDGQRERTSSISLQASYEFLRDVYLQLSWRTARYEQAAAQGLATGRRNELLFVLSWNY